MVKEGKIYLNIHNVRFVISAVSQKQFPDVDLPEVAFVGRSNVGKSSIINCLLNRKQIAKVGQTPGKTRMINFFNIDEKLHFVDLPGYGFASVSKDKKMDWANTIESYLVNRNELKLIVLLIDSRHNPTKDDKLMLDFVLNYNINFLIVATKTDKLPKTKIKTYLQKIADDLNLDKAKEIIGFSAKDKTGRVEVLEQIEKVI